MHYLKRSLCGVVFFCASAAIVGALGGAATASPTAAPQNPEALDPRDLQVLAILYIEQNQPWEAIPLLERSVDLYPENGETYMWLGVAQFFTEQFDEAEESLMKALTRNPGLTDVHNYMGLLRYKQGDLDGAVEEFLVALRDPAYPPVSKARVRLNLGNIYLETDRPEEARKHLADGIAGVGARSDQVYQPLHVQLAKALNVLDRKQEAVAALQKVLDVNPDNVDAHLLLGFAHRDMAQHRVARTHLERVLQLAPGTEISERAQAALARLPG